MTESRPSRRRYVPKGGYLVDFSERVTPKLRRLLEKEKERTDKSAGQDRGAQASEVPTPESQGGRHACGIEQGTNDTCMAMVVWSGDGCEQADLSKAEGLPSTRHRLPLSSSPSSSPSFLSLPSMSPVNQMAAISGASGTSLASPRKSQKPKPSKPVPPSRTSWKPPGCLRQSLWKRPIKAMKKSSDPVPCPPATPVQTCPTCASLADEKEVLHRKQRALHLKTIQVDALASKCAREMKEFEAYKEEELKRLTELKEAIKSKKRRDALAQTAEARASSQHTDLARLRIKVEEVEAALDAQRLRNKGDKEKHAVELQRYRDKISELKEEVSALKAGMGADVTAMPAMAAEGADGPKRNWRIDTPCTPGEYGVCASETQGGHERCGRSGTGKWKEGAEGNVLVHENNTVERRWDDGVVQYVYENGDVRQSDSQGVVEYLYADIECWNTSYPDGDHIYYFKDGRRECHGADGTVQILVDGHQRAYGCSGSQRGDYKTATTIPVAQINPKLLQACPTKR